MKFRLTAIAAATLALGACATTNPGNLSAGMMANQDANMSEFNTYLESTYGEDMTCDEVDVEVKAAYFNMQPEEVGLGKRVVGVASQVGEQTALSQVAGRVPGVGFANTILKGKKGKEKATAMMSGQMEQAGKLRVLNARRTELGCPGNMQELFAER